MCTYACKQLPTPSSLLHHPVIFLDQQFKIFSSPVLPLGYYEVTLSDLSLLVVIVLSYKPAGRGFDSRWCHWNFSVT